VPSAGEPAGQAGGQLDGEYRLYQDLAPWWPLISPPEEYAAEAACLARTLRAAGPPVRTALDLGSGGGHVALHLRPALEMTLVDLSPAMLAVSGRLNPGCEHVRGDMRRIRLSRPFDVVLVHDAVDYMITEADLAAVIATAFAHCRPGGTALFVPDHTAESYRPGQGTGGGSDGSGRQASFHEQVSDPDPADSWIEVAYEFRLRSAAGGVQLIRETHRLGAFGHRQWLDLLAGAGFAACAAGTAAPPSPPAAPGLAALAVAAAGPGQPRNLFIARRPA
jgi:SAM-dependent methyltransferase